jgi:signal transduction histidine kinase
MNLVLLLVLLASLVVMAVLGLLLTRSGRRAREAERSALQSDGALREQRQSAEGDRETQGLILGSMEEGVLLLGGNGDRVFANAALSRHLGSEPSDLAGILPLELQRATKRAGYTGATTRVEVETGVPTRWLRATAQPVGDDGSVLVVVRDVTEARRLDAVRRDFVTNASHELKTPVASIRAAAETLRDAAADDPPAVRRFADQLEREAMRLQRIVADLLDLSRLETGSDLEDRVRLDVVAMDEVARLREPADEAGISLQLEADGVPSVHGSERDLALLIRNLVDNAIRYTKPGGDVAIRITGDNERVEVRVSDTGVGIPTRDLPRVFERFYRVDRARSRETGGTGLGLAIVKHVAENHGGTVDLRSELGNGSTFIVTLPAAREP